MYTRHKRSNAAAAHHNQEYRGTEIESRNMAMIVNELERTSRRYFLMFLVESIATSGSKRDRTSASDAALAIQYPRPAQGAPPIQAPSNFTAV
jgi:hypothetical protein